MQGMCRRRSEAPYPTAASRTLPIRSAVVGHTKRMSSPVGPSARPLAVDTKTTKEHLSFQTWTFVLSCSGISSMGIIIAESGKRRAARESHLCAVKSLPADAYVDAAPSERLAAYASRHSIGIAAFRRVPGKREEIARTLPERRLRRSELWGTLARSESFDSFSPTSADQSTQLPERIYTS